jgi:hypothetical protein
VAVSSSHLRKAWIFKQNTRREKVRRVSRELWRERELLFSEEVWLLLLLVMTGIQQSYQFPRQSSCTLQRSCAVPSVSVIEIREAHDMYTYWQWNPRVSFVALWSVVFIWRPYWYWNYRKKKKSIYEYVITLTKLYQLRRIYRIWRGGNMINYYVWMFVWGRGKGKAVLVL